MAVKGLEWQLFITKASIRLYQTVTAKQANKKKAFTLNMFYSIGALIYKVFPYGDTLNQKTSLLLNP